MGLIVGVAGLSAVGLFAAGGAAWILLSNRDEELPERPEPASEPEEDVEQEVREARPSRSITPGPVRERAANQRRDGPDPWDTPLEHPVMRRVIAASNPVDSPLDAATAEDRLPVLGSLMDEYDGRAQSLLPAIELACDIHSKLREPYEPWVTLAECAIGGAREGESFDPTLVARAEFLARKANALKFGNADTESIAAEYRLRLGYPQEAYNRTAGIDSWRGRMVSGEACAELGQMDECRQRFDQAREISTPKRSALLALRFAELLRAHESEDEALELVHGVLAANPEHHWALRLRDAWAPPPEESESS